MIRTLKSERNAKGWRSECPVTRDPTLLELARRIMLGRDDDALADPRAIEAIDHGLAVTRELQAEIEALIAKQPEQTDSKFGHAAFVRRNDEQKEEDGLTKDQGSTARP